MKQKIKLKNDGNTQKAIQNDGSHLYGKVLKPHSLVKMQRK